MARIVVGIDGSEDSVGALERALVEARAHAADIEAVYVLPDPVPMWAAMPEAMYYPVEDPEERVAEARQQLEDVIARVHAGPDPAIRIRIEEGPPARTLLQAAEGADLLVLGTRGLGGFRGLLLGSVSHQCVSHATCPVLVVPAPVDAA